VESGFSGQVFLLPHPYSGTNQQVIRPYFYNTSVYIQILSQAQSD